MQTITKAPLRTVCATAGPIAMAAPVPVDTSRLVILRVARVQ